MALISLFFQTRAVIGRPSGLPSGGLELDASLQETHEANAELSSSEIEDGSTINDNVILLPIKLTLEGVVSKTPLGAAGLIGSAATAVAGQASKAGSSYLAKGLITTGVASVGGLIAKATGTARDPSDVWDYLLELRNARLPFDVVTALKLYKSMVVTGLSAPRSIQNNGVLRFTATLQQAKLVTAQSVTLSSVPGAAAAQNLGKQATSAAGAATSSNASLLYQAAQGVGVIP